MTLIWATFEPKCFTEKRIDEVCRIKACRFHKVRQCGVLDAIRRHSKTYSRHCIHWAVATSFSFTNPLRRASIIYIQYVLPTTQLIKSIIRIVYSRCVKRAIKTCLIQFYAKYPFRVYNHFKYEVSSANFHSGFIQSTNNSKDWHPEW